MHGIPRLVFFILFLSSIHPAGGSMPDLDLPEYVTGWTKTARPEPVTEKTIFDYMNGAGELYVGYRFDRLEVSEYRAEGRPDILVEIYRMKSPDDAFGLLSTDWGGKEVGSAAAGPMPGAGGTSPERRGEGKTGWPSALYGEGLLRMRAGAVYARIMAERETPAARAAVLELGRAAAAMGGGASPAPALIRELPEAFPGEWGLRRDRTAFFRTHLVLNSLYYLGPENMLELDHDVEGVSAVYERPRKSGGSERIRLLRLRYPDAVRARAALERFHAGYLPEAGAPLPPDERGRVEGVFSLEDGWLVYGLEARNLTLVFEAPDRETVRIFFRGRF